MLYLSAICHLWWLTIRKKNTFSCKVELVCVSVLYYRNYQLCINGLLENIRILFNYIPVIFYTLR